MGPKTDFADSNSTSKGASAYSKNTWSKFFQVVLLIFIFIKIYQLTKELKSNSVSSCHIFDPKNIISHLLQYI